MSLPFIKVAYGLLNRMSHANEELFRIGDLTQRAIVWRIARKE